MIDTSIHITYDTPDIKISGIQKDSEQREYLILDITDYTDNNISIFMTPEQAAEMANVIQERLYDELTYEKLEEKYHVALDRVEQLETTLENIQEDMRADKHVDIFLEG